MLLLILCRAGSKHLCHSFPVCSKLCCCHCLIVCWSEPCCANAVQHIGYTYFLSTSALIQCCTVVAMHVCCCTVVVLLYQLADLCHKHACMHVVAVAFIVLFRQKCTLCHKHACMHVGVVAVALLCQNADLCHKHACMHACCCCCFYCFVVPRLQIVPQARVHACCCCCCCCARMQICATSMHACVLLLLLVLCHAKHADFCHPQDARRRYDDDEERVSKKHTQDGKHSISLDHTPHTALRSIFSFRSILSP